MAKCRDNKLRKRKLHKKEARRLELHSRKQKEFFYFSLTAEYASLVDKR